MEVEQKNNQPEGGGGGGGDKNGQEISKYCINRSQYFYTMGQLCLNGDSIVSNSITNSPYGPQWQHSVSLYIMYRRTLLGSLLYTFSHLYYNREYDMTIHHR